jgi:hypothetical protein
MINIPFLVIRNLHTNHLEQLPENISPKRADDIMQSIHSQIEHQKQILHSKRAYLENAKKQNEFLENVQKDYKKYHDFIVNEKQQQMNAMTMLKSYLDDLIINGNLTNTDIAHAKLQHNKLMGEVDKIKTDLDELIITK